MTEEITDSDSTHQRPTLDWSGSVPIARDFNDPYYSLDNGLDETRYVFLQGNGLPTRFAEGFHIAELGFGTGLACLTALQAWHTAGMTGPLRFTSFEAFPMDPSDMQKALAPFPSLKSEADWLVSRLLDAPNGFEDVRLVLEIVKGDAREMVPRWGGAADAWFLDGFAPAKNPELWEPALLKAVAGKTHPAGTAATYTAAGSVRRALAEAGFDVERCPGYGRKRHMTRARLI